MNNTTTLIVLRLMVACIFAGGAVWLAHDGITGWGWLTVASVLLGAVTLMETKNPDDPYQ